jgi:hypothetical protein
VNAKNTAPAANTPKLHPAPLARGPLLAQLWRGISHPLPLTALLIIATAALIAHLTLPQLPTSLIANRSAATLWLDETAEALPAGALLRALGAFDLSHLTTLKILLALLTALLLIHLINDILRMQATRTLHPPLHWLPGLHAWDANIAARPDDIAHPHPATCPQPRHIVAEDTQTPAQHLYDCHARQQWLAMLLHLGLLLGLAALILNLSRGWQTEPLSLDWGQTQSLAPYTQLQIGLNNDGTALTLCCPETQIPLPRTHIMRGNVRLHTHNPQNALLLSLKQNDTPLKLQAIEQRAYAADELIVHFPQPRSERVIAAPEAQRSFRLTALDDGSFRVQALNAANQVHLSETIHQAVTLPLEPDLTLTIIPRSYITLNARGRPGTWLLWPALTLILAGLYARWRYPYWRLGILSNPAGLSLRWQGTPRTRTQFLALLHQLTPENTSEPDPSDD